MLQILRALSDPEYGWQKHPAVLMWKGHERYLGYYGITICNEWCNIRGFRDTCADKIMNIAMSFPVETNVAPNWIGDQDFHRSHQSNLKRKEPETYGHLWEGVPDDLPYVWPINLEGAD